MKTQKCLSIAFLGAALLAGSTLFAQETEEDMEYETVVMEKPDMDPSKTIAVNAGNTADFSTLVAALKAADLVGTLSGDGPFTVFAPTNAAFENLPEGTVESLLKPENKKMLTRILTFHVIAGKINAADVLDLLNKNNGKAKVTTVSGGSLLFYLDDGDVYIEDETGNTASLVFTDLDQSNGVIHVIDNVLLPGNKK